MIPKEVYQYLERAGCPLHSAAEEGLARHAALVREWNAYASLVSEGDLAALYERHVVDSLSLAPVLMGVGGEEGHLLDIGSGGGYPAVPLALVLSGWRVTMVERSAKKVGVLRKVIGALGLTGVTLVQGEFPQALGNEGYCAVTARAVERPERVRKAVLEYLPPGAVFVCQSGDPGPLGADTFHVERVGDGWSRDGFRRGTLYLVGRVG